MFRLLLDTALKTVTYRWQVIKIGETLVHRQIRFIPIKEGIEFDGQQDLRTKVMIAAGSYVVFQHQSGRSPSSPQVLDHLLTAGDGGPIALQVADNDSHGVEHDQVRGISSRNRNCGESVQRSAALAVRSVKNKTCVPFSPLRTCPSAALIWL